MKAIVCSVLVVLVVAGIFEAALPPPDNNFGGYHNREITDADVQEMAAFAAQEMGHELMEILAAQSAVCRFHLFIDLFIPHYGKMLMRTFQILRKG